MSASAVSNTGVLTPPLPSKHTAAPPKPYIPKVTPPPVTQGAQARGQHVNIVT